MDIDIIHTKLYIPPVRPDWVPRPRLKSLLNMGLERKVTLVSAPAGYGKTTLLSTWVDSSRGKAGAPRFGWLTLEESDNDPARFMAYLNAALIKMEPELGVGATNALRAPNPPFIESVMGALVNGIDSLPETDYQQKLVLILDDYHVIHEQSIHRAIDYLLEHMPKKMHLVLATRSDPPLDLALLYGRGSIYEIHQSDLSFTFEEACDYLVSNLEITCEDVATLVNKTEGWIAGLQMAVASMRGRDGVHVFVDSFAGTNRRIEDYLMQQVLVNQTVEMEEFLIESSILSRLSGDLCNAITGRKDGEQILNRLEQENLFILPLDDRRRWYRFHTLFADLLRERLSRSAPERARILHRSASSWYQEQGMLDEAVDHSLAAGDYERAVDLIEAIAENTWGLGEHARLQQWLDAIPVEMVRARPRLGVFYALVLFTLGKNRDAHLWLQNAQESLDSMLDDGDAGKYGMVKAARAYIGFAEGDLGAVIRDSRLALERLPVESFTWRSIANYTLGLALRLTGDIKAAGEPLQKASSAGRLAGLNYIALVADLNRAICRLQQGQLKLGVDILKHALKLADEKGMLLTPIAGLLSAYLGNIYTEWYRLDEAKELLERGLRLCERDKDVNALALCYVFLYRALQARGEYDGASDIAARIERLAWDRGALPWFQAWMAAWRARFFISQGNIERAAHLLDERGLKAGDEPTYLQELEYIALAELLAAQKKFGEAQRLLAKLLASALGGGRMGRVIDVLNLQALTYQATNDIQSALVPLAHALELGEAEMYTLSFVQYGKPMARLLYKAVQKRVSTQYAGRLLAIMAFDGTTSRMNLTPTIVEPLSGREIEILKLVAAGFSNQEIAQNLMVSLNTVKAHNRNIFAKLGAKNRTEAVARGRELGIF